MVTPCSFCGDWGLFCDACQAHGLRCLPGYQALVQVRQPEPPARHKDSGDRDYFSASQIENYQDCPRKWAWVYLDGVEKTSNVFAKFGLAGHGQIERYLKEGTPFDLTSEPGEAAMAGLHFLPRPGTPGMVIEGQFILTGWGHRFLGYKDIQINRTVGDNVLPDQAPIVGQIDPLRGQVVPLVIDHKFTGNFRWAKTETELRTNVQAVLYATHAMVQTGAEACDLRWIYYHRVRPWKSKPVDLRVYRGDLEGPLVTIKTLADEMALIKSKGLRAMHLPPNPEACGSYGGCPFVNRCNLSPQEKMIAIMSQASLEDRKNAFLKGLAGGPGAGPAVNPPGGQPPPNGAPPANWGQPPAQGAAPPTQGPPPGWGQPPPQGWTPPGQAPQGPPPGPPATPQIDEQVLIQARGVHPNWVPGTPWYNGQSYVNPGDPAYPPIYLAAPPAGAPQGGQAPMPDQAPAGGGGRRRGRPKKDQTAAGAPADDGDPDALAAEGLSRISEGFLFLKRAILNGLLGGD